jgi:adhesin transport system outer membrane protein
MKKTAIKTLVCSASALAFMSLAAPVIAAAQTDDMQGRYVPAVRAERPIFNDTPAAPQTTTTTTAASAAPMPVAQSFPQGDNGAAGALPNSGNGSNGGVPAPGQVLPPTNLGDAVGAGMRTNPEYGVVSTNRRATDEELRQAKSLYLPSIDYRGDTGVEHTENPSTRAHTGGGPQDLWRYDNSLTLTQMLLNGGETRYENERQKFRVESAARRVRETSELNGLAVVESFLEVLRQRQLLKIARDNVADHMSILSQINDSSTAGRTTQADVEQANARVASAKAEEASIRESLRLAEAGYILNVGEEPKDLVMPRVPSEKLDADVEREVKITLAQSPTIEIFESDIKVAHAEYEGAKSRFYPKVDLQLNAQNGRDLAGVRGDDTSASALAVVNWNLYRGGGDTANVREHIHREAQAKEQRAEQARKIENDVRETWAHMVAAGERAREFSTQASANAEVVKAYKDQFNLDRRTLLDVLDSQNEYFVSRSSAVNAEFLEMLAVYRLLALKGDLLKTLGLDYPREANPANM